MGDLNETQRYFIDEHIEDYMGGLISRRELLRRVTLISGSAVLAATIVAACGTPASTPPVTAATQSTAPSAAATAFVPQAYATPPATAVADGITVKETDPRITVSKPEVKGADGASLLAYMAKPAAASGKVPGVVVIHENRGQTEHIRDVVRRVATAGFIGINIDLAARDGGAAKLTDQAAYNAALGKRSTADKISDHNATITFLKGQSSGSVGVTGFCFGGGETWSVLASGADVKAAVPFYGPQPTNYQDMAKTKAAVSAVYAELDVRITTSSQQMEEVLKAAGVPYKITIYPGVNHAFHNDTGTPDRYNAEQAQKAWVATIEWFRKYL
ncbi:MAG: dienelactone hydrolase family protein [Chloroflexota bacterium]